MSTTEQIPFLDLISLHKELEEELLSTLRDTLRVAGFVGGPKVEEFEREFAKFCNASHCVCTSKARSLLDGSLSLKIAI